MATDIELLTDNRLYEDVCQIIDETRYRFAVYVNSEASMMNWHNGKRIKEDILTRVRDKKLII